MSKPRKRNRILPSIAIVASILCAGALCVYLYWRHQDETAWRKATCQNTYGAYDLYNSNFCPGGAHCEELISAYAQLDDAAWSAAVAENSVEAYQRYLVNYQYRQGMDSDREKKARTIIEELNDRDHKAWHDALSKGTVTAYEAYIVEHPKGRHTTETQIAKAFFANASDVFARKTGDAINRWCETYGTGRFSAIDIAPEGGFIAVGSRDRDLLVVRTEWDGRTMWERTFGMNVLDKTYETVEAIAHAVTSTADGGFIVAGQIELEKGFIDVDGWVLRLDSDGNLLWNKKYGSGYAEANAVVVTQGNELIVAGSDARDLERELRTNGRWPGDARILRIDFDGRLLESLRFGGRGAAVTAMAELSDGGIAIVGYKRSKNGSLDIMVHYRTTSLDGYGGWEYGGTYHEEGKAVALTRDGGLVVAGVARDKEDNSSSYLLRLNKNGHRLWHRLFFTEHKTSEARALAVRKGNILVAGYTDMDHPNMSDAWLAKFNDDGEMLCKLLFRGLGYNVITALKILPNGDPVIAGYKSVGRRTRPWLAWLNGDRLD